MLPANLTSKSTTDTLRLVPKNKRMGRLGRPGVMHDLLTQPTGKSRAERYDSVLIASVREIVGRHSFSGNRDGHLRVIKRSA
jgi:hypothetical protein